MLGDNSNLPGIVVCALAVVAVAMAATVMNRAACAIRYRGAR
ncbi:hypothetical protein [Nocardia beijingensis]|nr:hypothetical protein [Nocardia beijingensis]